MLQRALKIQETHYGEDHYQVAITLANLAIAHGALGDPTTKKEMLQRALKIKETHYGEDHYEVAITLTNLANAHGDLGDPRTKKELLQRALKILEAHYVIRERRGRPRRRPSRWCAALHRGGGILARKATQCCFGCKTTTRRRLRWARSCSKQQQWRRGLWPS